MDDRGNFGRPTDARVTRQPNDLSQQAVDRSISVMRNEITSLKEKIQILLAERGASGKPQAALLRGDILRIGDISMKSSKAAGDPPTQVEFNALWIDVQAIYLILGEIYRKIS